MRIAIFGTGYVGLVSGTCFAELGNRVTCFDIDSAKIERLGQGQLPIYEPGLAELVQSNSAAGRLHFTDQISQALEEAEIIFLAIGTPAGPDGSATFTIQFNGFTPGIENAVLRIGSNDPNDPSFQVSLTATTGSP